jgi:hypothetical protein
MAGKKGMKGDGLGGRRKGAGRPRGSRYPNTRAMLAELDRVAAAHPEIEDLLPSAFLKRVMLDEAAPLPARIMCAAKVIPFIERKPAPALLDEIPLFRHWTDEQYEDFERRLKEDAARDPHFYGRAFLEALGVPWPTPQRGPSNHRPPSDRWFAEIDSTTDQRRHKGGPRPWAPGERERLLQTPFHPEELARRRIYEPNGEDDPDPAA